MKHRIRVACLVGAGVAVAAFAACSGTTEPTAEADAAATPAPSAIPSPSTSTTAPPLNDAGDSGVLRDAVVDSEGRDVSDAADGADGYDGAPLPGSVETVVDIPGLTDFDFVSSHFVYRRGGPAPDFTHCTLPACADKLSLDGTWYDIDRSSGVGGWAVGDDARLHYPTDVKPSAALPTSYRTFSILFDNTDPVFTEVATNIYDTRIAHHGGAIGISIFNLSSFCGAIGPNPIWCSRSIYEPDGSANSGRVARAAGPYHTNTGGAVAHYTPVSRPTAPPAPLATATFDGVAAPVPATGPTLVAVSAAGPTVPHPTVVVLRDGNVEACPLATPCLAWLNLGALGTILNLDDRHLYIGTPTGLSRCALAEIGTAGTCTLVPHGPAEAVEEPLYLTTTHAWYRSGTQVRRVLK